MTDDKKDTKEMEEEKAPKKERAITKDMKLGEVIRKYPSAAAVMLEYGLHCIGCHVAEWESIEEGCRAHGIIKDEMEKMIDELNSPEVLEGKIVFNEKEAIEETKEEKMKSGKKGFFKRLNI